MKKIEKLSPEQESKIIEYRDEWFKIGLSTEAVNKIESQENVKKAYKIAGLKEPNIFIWLRSPLEGIIGAHFLIKISKFFKDHQVLDQVLVNVKHQVLDQVRDQVLDQVVDQVLDQVVAQVWDQVLDQVRDQIRDQVWDKVLDQVRAQVGTQVGTQVWDQVGNQVGTQVRNQVWDQVGTQVGTQVRDQIGAQVGDKVVAQVWDQVRDQIRDQIRNQVWDKVLDQVRDQVADKVGAQVWANVKHQVLAQVRDQVWDQIRDQVWDQIRDQVWDQVGTQVGTQVWNQVGNQVGTQVRNQVRDQVLDQVRDQIRAQVRDKVVDQVRAQVVDQVWAQVRDQVWNKVWDQVWAQVRNQVWDQIRDQVRNQVWAQVRNQIEEQIYTCAYGLHDANWLGFYEYFKNVVGLDCTKKLEPLIELSKHCGWWWPFENAVIFTEKPITLKRDSQNRLHAEGEKSLEYSDGFGVYAFHGVRLPEKYGKLKPENWDSKWILEEKNAELRRVLIQGIGYGKICRDLKAENIDSWKEYELLKINNADVEPIMMVKMSCPSTGLIHAHRVPPNIKTAREGIKWINHDIDKEEFLIEK